MRTFFAAIIEGDDSRGYGVDVIGTPVVGDGETRLTALRHAAETLQEVIDDAVRDGERVPTPSDATERDLSRGVLAMIQVTLPEAVA